MDKNSQDKLAKKKKVRFFSKHVGLKYFLLTFGSCLVIFGIIAALFILSILPPSSITKVSSSNEIISSTIVQSSSTVSKK